MIGVESWGFWPVKTAWGQEGGKMKRRRKDIPLILYSPVSRLLELRMLNDDEVLDPTVSCFSNPGCDDGFWPPSPE